MQTHTINVLWIDLCADTRNAQDITVICEINALFTIQQIDKEQLLSSIEETNPHIICLDYDFPDRQSLLLLRQLRSDYPCIPIIMMTTQHCENLAVWAFRTGVRDYLVKPLSINSLIEVLNSLATLDIPTTQNRRAPRQNLFIPPLLPNEFRHTTPVLQMDRIVLAFCYVETHFNEKIVEEDLAAFCGMTVFVFSKMFRQEHGMTFREFLLRYRIERAKDLLSNPAMTITDIAGLH
jgi:YesN/AraC family two-component response regulator